jgi:hypothetical protein
MYQAVFDELYARTKNKVKVEDERLKKAQARGSVVGREKVWSLAFVDELVIVAKSEREMKEMVKSLGKYVRKKKLEVNVEKTKIMVLNEKKSEENEWK